MKWQQFFEIPDGGDRHFEFSLLYISDVIDKFQIEVPTFPLIFVTIGKKVNLGHKFFVIQAGGGCDVF